MVNAIVLCSGGLDSVVTAYYINNKKKYKKIKLLFFNYGQRALKNERRFCKKNANLLKAEFIEIKLDYIKNLSSYLTDNTKKVLKIKNLKNTKKESEKWYVPCRNSIFIINALALAEADFIINKDISDIYLGFKCEGMESYPDTTKEFVEQMNKLSKISCSRNFKVLAPLIDMDKEDIIHLGTKLRVDFKHTFSCYQSYKKHCGYCLACKLRQAGFYWAGIKDPTSYENKASN